MRLENAWVRAGNVSALPVAFLNKYIPKVISDASSIAANIGQVMEDFGCRFPGTALGAQGPTLAGGPKALRGPFEHRIRDFGLSSPGPLVKAYLLSTGFEKI